MKQLASLILFAVISFGCAFAVEAAPKPNVLLIMADDLGFSDLGCYGGEIATPNLDAIAQNGLRFSRFYNTARCWPTRGALMTGYYAQQIRRDSLPGITSSGRGSRPDWAVLVPKLLKPAGYRSYHTGKWHIDGMPVANGFDHSYLLKDQGRFFNPNRHWKDDVQLPPVKKGTDFYATTALADHAIEVLTEHGQQHAEAPFFHYLAFAAPHFPLHALPEDIAIYEDTYTEGWDSIRRKRWQRMQKLGILDAAGVNQLSRVERDLGPPGQRRGQQATPVEQPHRRAEEVSGDEDVDPCGDDPSHGYRNRSRLRSDQEYGPVGKHAGHFPFRQWSECRDHGPRRRA
jgi:arylsulfatase